MGKITRNELSKVLNDELNATAANQQEILEGVNGIKTDTTAIKNDVAAILAKPTTTEDEYYKRAYFYGSGAGANFLDYEIVNVTGKGKLVHAFFYTNGLSPGTEMNLKVFIDSETPITLKLNGTNAGGTTDGGRVAMTSAGFIGGIGGNANYLMAKDGSLLIYPTTSIKTFDPGVFDYNHGTTTSRLGLYLLSKDGDTFNKSLKILATYQGTNTKEYSCVYTLD